MRVLLLLVIAALASSCGILGKAETETAYVVVDKSSNKAMSAYYVDSSDRVVRTETFGEDAKPTRLRSFEYDEAGNVRTMVETEPGLSPRTVNFTTEVIRDAQGRVERIVQRGDDGSTSESFFGYDEAGVLRGTVMRGGDDSVIMKDYQDE